MTKKYETRWEDEKTIARIYYQTVRNKHKQCKEEEQEEDVYEDWEKSGCIPVLPVAFNPPGPLKPRIAPLS